MKKIRGLGTRLLKVLFGSGVCAAFFIIVVQYASNILIQKSFSGSSLQRKMIEKRLTVFNDYVYANSISATDTKMLLKWCDEQPMVLMEIYRDNILFFNSDYNNHDSLSEQNIEATKYDWYSYYEITFSDGPAEVLIYSDESYILKTWITVVSTALAGVLFIAVFMMGIRKIIRYIYLLCDEIQIMGNGDLEHPITVQGKDELGLLAEELDKMRSALWFHKQKEQEMIRLNNDMITGLSHDLRTPLTKIMLYTDIIRNSQNSDEEQIGQYLERIREKGIQMKEISDHLLEYSLSQREMEMPEILEMSFDEALFDRLSEMTDYLSLQGFQVECDMNWSQNHVKIIESHLDRILDNIVSNIDKYADKAAPIRINFFESDKYTGFSVENIQTINRDKVDSSNVGVVNINTMMKEMNGICEVQLMDNAYRIAIHFANCGGRNF